MLIKTRQGLYCPAGNFYIDPSGAVDNAVVTHAHSDHARRGSKQYYCTFSGADLLKSRLGKKISVHAIPYNQTFFMRDVKVSFHPAGHILGSAQVRLEYNGEVWVASGDYKRESDPTCEPFEVVPCDVFVTEATFGTPGYAWPKNENMGFEIWSWWQDNARAGYNSIVFAYSLGKTQRVLGLLEPYASKEQSQIKIYCHSAAGDLNDCYRAQGVKLATNRCLSNLSEHDRLEGALILAPQTFLKSPQAQVLGPKFKTAFASGWMARNAYGFDHGFVLSDHADWNDLLQTVKDTGAKRVYVQHRGNGALVKHLKSFGLDAFPEEALIPENPNQMMLF
ncbi:MAG: ligase-associated DNA damage response exonuclease [Bdellovibrionales bacterium]